ncbi:MAG: BACON domain-containing carbohydrate-binding protein [Gemmatimonadaceae bacterium]
MRALGYRLSAGTLVFATISLASCTSPGEPATPPAIGLSSAALTFTGVQGASIASQTITISNTGGGSLNWSVASSANWVTVTPAQGTGPATITVQPSTSGLTAGSLAAIITITAPGAANTPRTIAVTLTLEQAPAIGLSATTLSFSATAGGSNPANQTINITNTGGSTLNWTAASNASWLTATPASGTGAATLTAAVNTSGLAAGTHNGTITIAASGASNTPRSVAVTLTLEQAPAIGLSATNLSFTGTEGGSNPANQTVNITNTGGSTLNWTAASDATWLTATPASGTGAATLTAAVNISGLAAGTYNGTITISASGASNTPRTIAVTLTVAAPANYSGSWTGKTSQDSTITLEIVNNAVTRIYLGWSVPSCGTTGTTTVNFTTPFSVASGSFTRTVSGSPMGFTLAGTFSAPKAVAGNLTLNFSMTTPFNCSATINLTWSATRP